ncbi:MAG TPA: hypothetical protein VI485_21980 [Vicinamibacterales bacterium]|nr:hypothetical protein [Vicinamibacterales bacterium]
MRLLSTAAAPALVFVTVWAFRFLSMGALENDHFVALARAHQMLHGDWPVRDFFDPGQPLAYLTSAAAAALFGPTLLTDVALATTLLALASVLTYTLAYRASGSVLVATAAVAVGLAVSPRLYNAGKLLLPLGAVGLGWRYADAPSVRRLAALAVWSALACLWRHDYAVYIAVPVMVLLMLTHDRTLARRRIVFYAGLCTACLLPWFLYVQWAGGLGAYLASAVGFVVTEGQRTVAWWPDDVRQRSAFVALMGIPIVAMVLARRSRGPLTFAHIAYAAAIALVANIVLLRDVIVTRMPDVIGLVAVLAAWIAGRAISRQLLRTAGIVALALVSAFIVIRLASQGYGMPTPAKVARRFATVSDLLRRGAPEVIPNRERLPLIRYLESCTPPTSRVLVSGFGPEIPVLAHRPFAGGLATWIPGYYTHPAEVERAAARLLHERVSIAVMLEGAAAFTESWPALAADLRARHFVERSWRLDGTTVVVWVPDDVAARSPSAPPSC